MQSYKKISDLSIVNRQSSIEILSHLGFLTVIALSAWHHELRSAFGPSAMLLFNLINESSFFAGSTWFSAHWFQNLMTVLAVKSNLSFSFVSLVFSASPMVFLYCVFLITNYVFKQKNSGIFLLLLLFGVNQTFFGAVHTPLILAATIYLILVGFRGIWTKYRSEISPFIELLIWAIACLFLFVRVSPIAYSDVANGIHSFSFLGYFSSIAISVFVISFAMAAYLALFWFHRKQFNQLGLLIGWSILMLFFIFIFGRNGLVNVDFELLFFPLIAGYIGFFVLNLEKQQQSTTQFWIVSALVVLAIFGQLRTFSAFEKRQNYVVRLLQYAPKTGDKFALPESLQMLERYVDPTFLAFETPIISKFRGLPPQSIFFIPENNAESIPRITNQTFNPSYFHFISPNYTILEEAFIPQILLDTIVFDVVAITGGRVQFGLTTVLNLQRNDSISISAMRKGSDFGLLVLSDDKNQNLTFWQTQQHTSEPNDDGWQKLSLSYIIPKTQSYRMFVMNERFRSERIYFKDVRIEIWRK